MTMIAIYGKPDLWSLSDIIVFNGYNDAIDLEMIKEKYNKPIGILFNGFNIHNSERVMMALPHIDYIFLKTDGATRPDLISQFIDFKMLATGFNVKFFCKIKGISAADLKRCVKELKYYGVDGLWFEDDLNYKRITLEKYVKTYRDKLPIWIKDTYLPSTEVDGYIFNGNVLTIDMLAKLKSPPELNDEEK